MRRYRHGRHFGFSKSIEFTLTPRALFAPDCSILPCTDKSKLIHSLDNFGKTTETHADAQAAEATEQANDIADTGTPSTSPSTKIAVVDGMVLAQKMTKKPATITTVKDLGHHFNDRLMNMTAGSDVIILVFDTYKADSLKQKTREKRRQGKDPVQYQIADDTNIKHIPMGRFLSHENTKADLTIYLAEATLEYNANSPKLIITSASGHTRSNQSMQFDPNNHEEADTLMISLAVAASQRYPEAQPVFFTPDTDVLVLAVAAYDKLCKHTSIAMVSGMVEVGPIWRAIGRDKATALPVFHAFTGAENVGRFSGVGKPKWFQHHIKAERNIVKALMKLPEDDDLTQEVKDILASSVCLAYCPKGIQIASIPDLRWHLFCKHLAESNKLPPTTGALEEHIERVRVQSRVWCQATVMWQQLFDPLKHGYHQDDKGHILPITTKVLPAPQAIVELVRSHCKANCSTQRCSCRRNDLTCTDLCLCGTDCENDADCIVGYDTQDSEDELSMAYSVNMCVCYRLPVYVCCRLLAIRLMPV